MLSAGGWLLATNFGNKVVSTLQPLINSFVWRTLSPQQDYGYEA
jgi:hypothetical protein